MVTGNENSRHPPLGESTLRGRRKVPQPRLEPITIDPRATRTTNPPRSSPRSPQSPRRPPPTQAPHAARSIQYTRSRSPIPPGAQSAPDDRPWIPPSLRAGSPQEAPEDWRIRRPVRHAPTFPPPDRQSPRGYLRDNNADRPGYRKAPPARGALRTSMSTSKLNGRQKRLDESPDRLQELSAQSLPLPRFPSNGAADDNSLRTSVNSNMTSRSSIEQNSGTERSSVLTKSSSITDLSPDTPNAPYSLPDGGMSVEDAISMYLDGFSDVTEEPGSPTSQADSKAPSITPPPSRDMNLEASPPPRKSSLKKPPVSTLQKPTFPPRTNSLEPITIPERPGSEPLSPKPDPPEPMVPQHAFVRKMSQSPEPFVSLSPPNQISDLTSMHQRQQSKIFIPGQVPPPLNAANDTRDEFGFRKATQHVTLPEYEAWKRSYSTYATHRRSKWYDLFREHGLPTSEPTKFPPQSSKVKRFVRKGIPSEFRGAAWFCYSGGQELLNRNAGYYDSLVEKVMNSPSNDDKEHIERDLHRTFPDNIHFKPENADNPSSPGITTETAMIQSLRRVLYAFALHNPKVGYTQSLNFITGMFLLFLPEEKAFWMLHITTSMYLPGTHEISLEGANIDLWILMVLLRDSMPHIYSKISSMGGAPQVRGKVPPLTVNSRLPDITLGLTNWLMSVFIGTLPLETTLRVWDIFFYEGSKTFFRVSLAIFKACEREIMSVSDPMEVFQVVQTVPKKLLDVNTLLEDCFVRRHRVGQGRIEELRAARRTAVRQEKMRRSVAFSKGQIQLATDDLPVRRRLGEQKVVNSLRHLKQQARGRR